MHSLRDGFAELRREGDPRAEASLLRTLEGLEPMQITQVIRALGSYAALLNVVDEAHAQSRRRASNAARRASVSGSRSKLNLII